MAKKKHLDCSNYSELLKRLKKILLSNRNSISKQLIFATKHLRISKLIEWCSKQESSCFRNPDLKIFSQLGFISVHSIFIRGLAFGNQKNEISLCQALDLIRVNASLINRRNFVCIDNIPYSYEDAIQVEQKELSEKLQTFECITQNHSPADISKRRHQLFDILSNTTSGRRETDVLRQDFFERLKTELKKCEDTKRFANSYVTHRHLEEESSDTQNQSVNIRIKKLEKNYTALWKIFNTFTHYFFDAEPDPILHTTHQLTFIEEPMVKLENQADYEAKVKQFEHEDKSNYRTYLTFQEN